MNEIITPSNITFGLGIICLIFTVYNYFRKPQIEADKIDTVLSLNVSNMQKDLINLRDNHIHTIEQKIEATNANLNSLSLQVGKLATIIDERIPRNISK